jgi:hypothetical protein
VDLPVNSFIRIISIVGERRGNWWKFISNFVGWVRPVDDKKPDKSVIIN